MHDRAGGHSSANVQDRICAGSGAGRRRRPRSARTPGQRPGGGGGRTRVIADGAVFEKAGVNFSEVFGEFSPEFAKQVPGDGLTFTATGVSLVLHPRSPLVPTVHANFRFLTHGSKAWFGGGADLTPYYPLPEDVVHFHRAWKQVCDGHAPRRRLRQDEAGVRRVLLPAAPQRGPRRRRHLLRLPRRRRRARRRSPSSAPPATRSSRPTCRSSSGGRDAPYTAEQRFFQEYRRGRYVEFNLVYDRGTVFGLKTDGRTESILMSLPPVVRYLYDYQPRARHAGGGADRVLAEAEGLGGDGGVKSRTDPSLTPRG